MKFFISISTYKIKNISYFFIIFFIKQFNFNFGRHCIFKKLYIYNTSNCTQLCINVYISIVLFSLKDISRAEKIRLRNGVRERETETDLFNIPFD